MAWDKWDNYYEMGYKAGSMSQGLGDVINKQKELKTQRMGAEASMMNAQTNAAQLPMMQQQTDIQQQQAQTQARSVGVQASQVRGQRMSERRQAGITKMNDPSTIYVTLIKSFENKWGKTPHQQLQELVKHDLKARGISKKISDITMADIYKWIRGLTSGGSLTKGTSTLGGASPEQQALLEAMRNRRAPNQ